ncbi:hypothetical protein DPV78_010274 [Talaromyces pinophilus]|nr:hypothetical protein DPV78_010274 [Talaromyces pinophilus]
MPGTSVTFLTDSGDSNIGTVKGFEDGKYRVEVEDGKIIEIEEAKVNEFKIQMTNRGIFETLK